MNNSEFIRTLRESMGNPKVKSSADGKALFFNGEFARGIKGRISFRPSKSTGTSFDVEVDGHVIKHVDNSPKF